MQKCTRVCNFSKLKEYRIDIDEISVALNFTARLAKEVLVAEFMNSTMDRDGCVDTILASTCYFLIYGTCSSNCKAQHACPSFCNQIEAKCPGLREFVNNEVPRLKELRFLFGENVFRLLYDFIYTYATTDCTFEFVSNRTGCVNLNEIRQGMQANASSSGVTNNCSAGTWNTVDSAAFIRRSRAQSPRVVLAGHSPFAR